MHTLLQINSVVNTGSTGRIAEDIGNYVINQGWNSYIAYGRKAQNSHSLLIKIGNDWDIIKHGIQTRLWDKQGLGSYQATRKFIEQIKQIHPDLIHLHNLHGYYINIELLFDYLQQTHIPLVWTLHDCWTFTGHCAFFEYVGCDKWKTECFQCKQKNKYPASLSDRSRKNFQLKKNIFTRLSNLSLVPVSNWLSEQLDCSFFQNYPRYVIHNGIDTNIFKPTNNSSFRNKYHIENQFIILGIANIWEERKGLNDFIALNQQINKNFTIVLIGLNSRQIQKLPSGIIGITQTENRKELAEIYSTADVFFNPTWEDNFPTTNLEALACGTPVITYNTGGSPEALTPQTGFVVNKGNIKEVLKCINLIKEQNKQTFSPFCRTRVEQYFSKENKYAEYLALYKKILADT